VQLSSDEGRQVFNKYEPYYIPHAIKIILELSAEWLDQLRSKFEKSIVTDAVQYYSRIRNPSELFTFISGLEDKN